MFSNVSSVLNQPQTCESSGIFNPEHFSAFVPSYHSMCASDMVSLGVKTVPRVLFSDGGYVTITTDHTP